MVVSTHMEMVGTGISNGNGRRHKHCAISRFSCRWSTAMSEGRKSRLFLYATLEPKDHDLDEVSRSIGDLVLQEWAFIRTT